ncbi:hypothetical protein BC835DRAFT_1270127 [Cytidiella melzeri]|nr:hypothetical protein BC835DRAFT_1270127 [Cytidiella melzeri]
MSRDKSPKAAPSTGESEDALKPLPNPSTGSANPSASLPALWGYLQPALDHIVRGPTNNPLKVPAIEVSYHMGVHTAVYNYFTSQVDILSAPPPKSVVDGPYREHKDVKPSGTDLYEQLDRYYADTAHEIFLGAPHDDGSLIYYLLPCFYRYSAGSQSVNRLLNYVNRHYVKRAVDEDKGWLRFADLLDAVVKSIKEDDTRDMIQRRLKERKINELKKWGYHDGAPPEVLAQAEACAEAASSLDRVVPLSSLALRRFRTEVIVPLLAISKDKKGGKKKKPPAAQGNKPALPKGRLARAVKELLETERHDPDERDKTAGELAVLLRTVGVHASHALRKKLDSQVSR